VQSGDVGKINRTDQCYKCNAHRHVRDQEDGMQGVLFFTPNICHAVPLSKLKNNLQCYNTSCLISYNLIDGTKGSMDFINICICQRLKTCITLMPSALKNTHITLYDMKPMVRL